MIETNYCEKQIEIKYSSFNQFLRLIFGQFVFDRDELSENLVLQCWEWKDKTLNIAD